MDYAALALPQTMTTNLGESKAMILKTNIHNETIINNYIDNNDIDDDDEVSIAIENNDMNRYNSNSNGRRTKTTPKLEVSSHYSTSNNNKIMKQPINNDIEYNNDDSSFEDDFASDSNDEEVKTIPINKSFPPMRNITSNFNDNNSSSITNGLKKGIMNKTNIKSNNVTPSFNNINSVMNFAMMSRNSANNIVNKNIGSNNINRSTPKHIDTRKESDPPWWFKLAADIGPDIVALLEQSKTDYNINQDIIFDGNDIQNGIYDFNNDGNSTMNNTNNTNGINSVVLLKGHDADDISKYYNQYGIIIIKDNDCDEMEICI
jgi:hypothetical protein